MGEFLPPFDKSVDLHLSLSHQPSLIISRQQSTYLCMYIIITSSKTQESKSTITS